MSGNECSTADPLNFAVRPQKPSQFASQQYTKKENDMKRLIFTFEATLLVLGLLLLVAPAFAQRGVPLSEEENPELIGKRDINRKDFNLFSLEEEIKIGRLNAALINSSTKFVENQFVTEYINRIVQNLVLHSDAKIPFTIKIMNSDKVDDFALPGGFIYLSKKSILTADNESELAAQIAHLIAHVTARHYTELMSIETRYNKLKENEKDNLFSMGSEVQRATDRTKFFNRMEEEADRLAGQYLWAAGYDPDGLGNFLSNVIMKTGQLQGAGEKTVCFMWRGEWEFMDFSLRSYWTLQNAPRGRVFGLKRRLPERSEYIVNTSGFIRAKCRLEPQLSSKQISACDEKKLVPDPLTIKEPAYDENNRPTIKRRQPSSPEATDTNARQKSTGNKEQKPTSDRPTLQPYSDTSNQSIAPAVWTQQDKLQGRWEGTMVTPRGEQQVVFIFKKNGDIYTGTITNRMQGGDPLDLKEIRVTGDKVTAKTEVKSPQGIVIVNYSLLLKGETLEGEWEVNIAGQAFSSPIELKRVGEGRQGTPESTQTQRPSLPQQQMRPRLASQDAPQASEARRKYAPMSAEEARQLIRKAIEKGEIPPPLPGSDLQGTSYWKVGEDFQAFGIKINDNDYIVFAPAKALEIVTMRKRNLPEIIPAAKEGKDETSFSLRGVFFSTIGLDVLESQVLSLDGGQYKTLVILLREGETLNDKTPVEQTIVTRSGGGKWSREPQIIERGGYKLCVGVNGVLLLKKNGFGGDPWLIAFGEPLKEKPSQSVYQVELSTSAGQPSVVFRIDEKDILRLR